MLGTSSYVAFEIPKEPDVDRGAEEGSMNSTRLVFRIHSWLGLIAGAVLLVMILSGVYLVYRAELDRWANPELRVRPVAAQTASIDQMVHAARTSFPDLRAGYLMFPTEPWMTFVAFLREKGPDGEVIRHQVYIDTGTGQVVGHRLSYHFLADWMVRIHEGLWLPDFWGQPLVALTGVLLALSSLTGLWVYRKRVWAALRWQDAPLRVGRLHSYLGVWSLLFSLVLGITGTVINYSSIPVLFHTAQAAPLEGVEWSALDRMPSMDALVAESVRVFPAMIPRYIYYPRSGGSAPGDTIIKVGGVIPGHEILGSSSSVSFAAALTVRVVATYDARQAPWTKKLRFLVTALHYGDFWGHVSKIAYVIGGLVLAFLAGSGLWIGLRPRRRNLRGAAAV